MGDVQFDAARLQNLMDRRNVSDYDLAEMTGISRTMIYYLRKGQRKSASAEAMTKLAEALETTVDYLLGKDGDDDRVVMLLPETVRRLAEIANRLSDVRREELVRMAAALEELEKEMPVAVMDGQTMEMLLEVVDKLRAEGAEGDPLESLETLTRLAQSRTLFFGSPLERVCDPG